MKLIPNVEQLTMKPKCLDPYLYKFGLKKNLGSRVETTRSSSNRKLNRYIAYQRKRLLKLSRTDNEQFWKLNDHLVRSSKAFRMLGLINVRPNWYKDYSWKEIQKELKTLNGICYRPKSTYEIRRTGIPKPDGGTRFINDPGIAWRIYLWIENHIAGYWFNERVSPKQHGHRPGKGSVTCWKDIMARVDKYPYIYEFDYTKFHDRIDRHLLMRSLQFMGVSDERVRKYLNLMSPWIRGFDEKDSARMTIALPEWRASDRNRAHRATVYNHFAKGVVQGNNLAGFIGLSALEYLRVYENSMGEYIGYADDGILFLKDPKGLEEFKKKLGDETGIELKESKSGWVKYENEWKKDLRFVGIRLHGPKRELYANTHSGKTWKMEWHQLEETLREHPWILKNEDTSPNTRSPYYKVKTLNFDNGGKYLGYLFSKIWSEHSWMEAEQLADKSLRYLKQSLIGEVGISKK